MERNIYGALLGLAAFGLILNIEWLFLTFLLLAGGLFLAERFSAPAAPSFEGAAWPETVTPQGSSQPVVIQASTQSPASTMMMEMVSNLVQESSTYHRPKSPWKDMTGKMDDISKKLKKLEKKLDEANKKKGGGNGHGGHH